MKIASDQKDNKKIISRAINLAPKAEYLLFESFFCSNFSRLAGSQNSSFGTSLADNVVKHTHFTKAELFYHKSDCLRVSYKGPHHLTPRAEIWHRDTFPLAVVMLSIYCGDIFRI